MWTNARLASQAQGGDVIDNGVLAASNGRIVYAGPMSQMADFRAERTIDCGGRLMTPGLIDCHTHILYAGDRAAEFERRLRGETYESIARSGGGILSTVKATRAATEDDLVAATLPRLDALMAEGVTTVEIKSGYGLTLADELKMLKAINRLAEMRDVRVVPTFLGAHAAPPEFASKDAYIDAVCDEMIPVVALENLAEAVDGFCEGIAFSPEQIGRVFAAAAAQGLRVKLHAEQLSWVGGAQKAAEFRALSADHLEYATVADVAALAVAGTVAVLLPGAFYFTRETKPPPVDLLRQAGVPIALATDCNPGTSPLTSLLLAMNMAATLFRMTPQECLDGVTRNAAAALGKSDEIGTLEPGKACDFCLFDAASPAALVYRIGFNPLYARVRNGRWPMSS